MSKKASENPIPKSDDEKVKVDLGDFLMSAECGKKALEEKKTWTLDEESNAIDYLERSVRFLLEIDKDQWAFKWAVIAIHGALYGFGVCSVCGVLNETKDFNVVGPAKKGRKLKRFDNIIEMCQDKQIMNRHGFSRPLILNDHQKKAINWLKTYIRNPVEHFIPCGLFIGTPGIPLMIKSCYEVIEFLAIESGNILLEPDLHAWVKSLCESGKSLSANLKINPDGTEKEMVKPYFERLKEAQ